MVSGLNPARFDAGDISSIARVERCSQLFLGTTGPPASELQIWHCARPLW